MNKCNLFRGLLTITPTDYRTNVDLWLVAHSSAFVKKGYIRVDSSTQGSVLAAAYKSPNGAETVVVLHTTYWDNRYDVLVRIDGQEFILPNVERESSISIIKKNEQQQTQRTTTATTMTTSTATTIKTTTQEQQTQCTTAATTMTTSTTTTQQQQLQCTCTCTNT